MRRWGWIGALVAALLASTLTLVPRGRPAHPAGRLLVRNTPYFLAGVNYPWKTFQDFGTGGWGHQGVSNPTTYAEVDTDFANLAASGVKIVKWRIFNDGRYSPEFDAAGHVTGLDEHFFRDLDAALELARRHDLFLIFTLFNSGFWTTDCAQEDGVQFGGRSALIRSRNGRAELVQRAIIPLLRHIGRNDRVLAFEIIAEPEWGIVELHQDDDNRIKVPLADVRALVTQVAAAIHFYTPALATVEANRSSNMTRWRGLGIDYYSFSWYDWLETWEPLDRGAATFGLDRPVVLGEFPSWGSKHYALPEVYELMHQQGYAGAFAWSYGAGDPYSRWSEVADGYRAWVAGSWAEVNVSGHGEPPGDRKVELQPSPYELANVQLLNAPDELRLLADVRVRDPGIYRLKWFLNTASSKAPISEQEQTVSFSGTPRRMSVGLGALGEDASYKVSLGVFDEGYRLVKWFEGLLVLRREQGATRVVTSVLEDPCGRQKVTEQ